MSVVVNCSHTCTRCMSVCTLCMSVCTLCMSVCTLCMSVCTLCMSVCLSVDYVCGGELFTHLHQIGPFTEDQTKVYAAEVTLALEHLHNVSTYPLYCVL